jgi:hypothetical protein
MSSRTLLASFAALGLAAAALTGTATGAAFGAGRHSGHGADLLRSSLVGSLLSDQPVFGATRGGAPWDLARGSAVVRPDGRTTVKVKGLLIPGVGVGQVGTVSASLACNGAVVDTSDPVPLSSRGDATIKDRLRVPARCIAPVVMVNPNGRPTVFIAISGRQS